LVELLGLARSFFGHAYGFDDVKRVHEIKY
jgi:hypothetical protein